MNRRQRMADQDMRYLGAAWRSGYDGPGRHPKAPSIWVQIKQQGVTIRYEFDETRVNEIFQRWLKVAEHDRYLAAILKLHYRDRYPTGRHTFPEKKIREALDRLANS